MQDQEDKLCELWEKVLWDMIGCGLSYEQAEQIATQRVYAYVKEQQ